MLQYVKINATAIRDLKSQQVAADFQLNNGLAINESLKCHITQENDNVLSKTSPSTLYSKSVGSEL